MHDDFSALPVIDVAPFAAGKAGKQQVAAEIDAACRQSGFFYVIGHGVDADLQHDLLSVARQFFALPTAEKMQIEMSRGGKAWRGYFRVGDELTSGRPDQKEGLYFGQELPAAHPLVLGKVGKVFPGLKAKVLRILGTLPPPSIPRERVEVCLDAPRMGAPEAKRGTATQNCVCCLFALSWRLTNMSSAARIEPCGSAAYSRHFRETGFCLRETTR